MFPDNITDTSNSSQQPNTSLIEATNNGMPEGLYELFYLFIMLLTKIFKVKEGNEKDSASNGSASPR